MSADEDKPSNGGEEPFSPLDVFEGVPLSEDRERELRGQVKVLVAEHGLEWDEVNRSWLCAEGDLSTRQFEAPLLDDDVAYWVTLHEIGHHVLGLPTFADDGVTVIFENEERAWVWALDMGRIPLSNKGALAIQGSLMSHGEQVPPPELDRRMRNALPTN